MCSFCFLFYEPSYYTTLIVQFIGKHDAYASCVLQIPYETVPHQMTPTPPLPLRHHLLVWLTFATLTLPVTPIVLIEEEEECILSSGPDET